MATNSNIEWCHHTGNPWWGCTEVHEGCDNCYARAWAHKYGNKVWGNDQPRKAIKSVWGNFAKWQKDAETANEIHRVFVGSMMDIFEKPMPVIDSNGSTAGYKTDVLRDRVFNQVVPASPHLMFLFLTKRPSNINKYIPDLWKVLPPRNVMYGASVVDKKSMADVDRHLGKVNGQKFLSIEPLLEEISLLDWTGELPDWVIVGGESGPKRRPFDPDWARRLKAECYALKIKFFMKQIDKVIPVPEDLMRREFPDYHTIG